MSVTRSSSNSPARTRRVAFQPVTYRSLQRGINQLARAIRPTLGPRPRLVAIQRALDDRMPELLDDGGTIAQRIVQLPDWRADVGAMFLRDVLWRLKDQAGDGTATATVLFQTVYNEGVRYLTSGGNAVRLQAGLQKGARAVLDQLAGMTMRVEGPDKLAQVARTICYDPPLAALLGEIFDVMGEYGRLEIRPGRSRQLEREYVEGMYWERGLVSREMIADIKQQRTEFEDAAILISDLDIKEPQQLFPALELALRNNVRSLLIVAGMLSDRTIGFLLKNKQPERFQVIAVPTPGHGREEQKAALEDLSLLTGGRPFIQVAGDTFQGIKLDDFGRARRVWADRSNFGFVGGKGNPRAVRQHIATLRKLFQDTVDPVLHENLLKRIGKLMGGSATLWVGGETELEINERVERAKRTAAGMRGAMMDGVLPGAGTALLACRPVLQRLRAETSDPDERAAYRIVARALAEPFRTIVANAGFDASDALAEAWQAGPGWGFDVTAEQVVDVAQAGIWDAASVQKTALYAALASAGMALTVDVMIHRPEQPKHASIHTPSPLKKI